MIKKFFMKKIDNYIIKHHSQNYIRREMITKEIEKRIEKALKRNNEIRDIQEKKKTEAQKLEFDIQEGTSIDIALEDIAYDPDGDP